MSAIIGTGPAAADPVSDTPAAELLAASTRWGPNWDVTLEGGYSAAEGDGHQTLIVPDRCALHASPGITDPNPSATMFADSDAGSDPITEIDILLYDHEIDAAAGFASLLDPGCSSYTASIDGGSAGSVTETPYVVESAPTTTQPIEVYSASTIISFDQGRGASFVTGRIRLLANVAGRGVAIMAFNETDAPIDVVAFNALAAHTLNTILADAAAG